MSSDYRHRGHFRAIAPSYRGLRLTDEEPIACIATELEPVPVLQAADIGCGTGRYTSLLAESLQQMEYILCIDYSAAMLRQLRLHFMEERLEPPMTIKASAMGLPLQSESLNCIFTFNAIHHFVLSEFLHEAARLLQPNGYLFVYTRTRTQNSQTIWGRHFPWFASKESRLRELDELSGAIDAVPALDLMRVQAFRFQRHGKLVDLIHRARNHHYSTFGLYSPREFNAAVKRFARSVLRHFPDAHNVRWIDENTLLTLRKTA